MIKVRCSEVKRFLSPPPPMASYSNMFRIKNEELGDIINLLSGRESPFLPLGQLPKVSGEGSKWECILECYVLSFALLSCVCEHSFPSPLSYLTT